MFFHIFPFWVSTKTGKKIFSFYQTPGVNSELLRICQYQLQRIHCFYGFTNSFFWSDSQFQHLKCCVMTFFLNSQKQRRKWEEIPPMACSIRPPLVWLSVTDLLSFHCAPGTMLRYLWLWSEIYGCSLNIHDPPTHRLESNSIFR